MRTYTRYRRCEQLGLLRQTKNGSVVVSSAALYQHLGPTKYAAFIRTITPDAEPKLGFTPETVERYLGSQ